MGVPEDSVLTEVSCPRYCLPPEPEEEIFLEILKEMLSQTQLLQNRTHSVSKPCRFQGTLIHREF